MASSRSRHIPTWSRPVVAALAVASLAVGCGSDDDTSTVTTDVTTGTGTSSPAGTLFPVPDVTLDDDTQTLLQSTFEEGFGASGMPGAAAYVSIGDEVWTSSLGVDDLQSQAPYDPEGKVRIASNTKTFTATAVLELVDDGEVSLDDTIDQYVDGITNGDRITIRDILAMRSGIWDFTSDDDLVARFDADPTFEWDVSDTVDLIKGKPASFEPGAEVQYCDSNYVLLGVVIEEASGMTAAEFINSRVVEPLGLTDTRFPLPGETEVPDPHPTGYQPTSDSLGDLDQLTPVGGINPQFAWTAGAMSSTLGDLAVWAEALADGELLETSTQEERLEGQRFDGQQVNFGYGLGVIRLNDFVGHDGAIIGYSSVVMRYPEADATFVIVGNASNNFTTPTMDIFLAMVKELYPDQLS
jgi:D-alanyl-D-alanine carboxypeptidase